MYKSIFYSSGIHQFLGSKSANLELLLLNVYFTTPWAKHSKLMLIKVGVLIPTNLRVMKKLSEIARLSFYLVNSAPFVKNLLKNSSRLILGRDLVKK